MVTYCVGCLWVGKLNQEEMYYKKDSIHSDRVPVKFTLMSPPPASPPSPSPSPPANADVEVTQNPAGEEGETKPENQGKAQVLDPPTTNNTRGRGNFQVPHGRLNSEHRYSSMFT